uniref:ER lumen protein-retaining receptor n=1 Tax=Lactuca sativa TaxID=4236 RepID=A0A9R1WSM1_LACSA|nr:hypothetical protein LSAT_V11C100044030 [Lactuca sativa]
MYACHIKLYFAIPGLLAPIVIKKKACSGWFSFMKTGCVALVLCLNISVDPPDVIKISPCARIISILQNVQICWAFSIYLEAVAILPQLVLLQRSGNVDNLTGQYVFFLGAYRALYILNWICRYLTQPHFNGWICKLNLFSYSYCLYMLYEEGHLRLYSSPGWQWDKICNFPD